jgi:hypothetical protein
LASATPVLSTSNSYSGSGGHPDGTTTTLSRSATHPVTMTSSTTTSGHSSSTSHGNSSSSSSSSSSSGGHGNIERWHAPSGSVIGRAASVSLEDVQSLILFFINEYTAARANGHHPEVKAISDRVHGLFGADNIFSLIDNHHGQYCTSYPPQLVVIEAETTGKYARDPSQRGMWCSIDCLTVIVWLLSAFRYIVVTCEPGVNELSELKPYFHQSRFNRVHGRFIMPTIMVHSR